MSHPSRRTLLRTAAWTAPAITVVASAPAFANTGAPEIIFNPGSTRMVNRIDQGGFTWQDLAFEGASVDVFGTGGTAILSMTVTFAPDSEHSTDFDVWETPTGWSVSNALSSAATASASRVFTYDSSIAGGERAEIMDGSYFGQSYPSQEGTFHLQFSATGYSGTSWSITTLPVVVVSSEPSTTTS